MGKPHLKILPCAIGPFFALEFFALCYRSLFCIRTILYTQATFPALALSALHSSNLFYRGRIYTNTQANPAEITPILYRCVIIQACSHPLSGTSTQYSYSTLCIFWSIPAPSHRQAYQIFPISPV